MKNLTKRLLSLALSVVMLFALIPANAMPAHAEGELTVTAYPASIAVGQTSALTVTGMTGNLSFKSSNEAVATVEDGIVTGVHSGTATITVTDVNDATGTCDIVVTNVSTYKIGSSSFNIGNDTNSDGTVDDFGGNTVTCADGTKVTVLNFGENPTTNAAANYIPFYVTGSSSDAKLTDDNAKTTNGYAWYRGRETNMLRLYPLYSRSGYENNQKYFSSYDYLNLTKTSPWTWVSEYSYFNNEYGIAKLSTYLATDMAYIGLGQKFTDGRNLWATLKLEVPASGEYSVTVNTGASCSMVESFYMVPTSAASTNNSAVLLNDNYKLFSIDIKGTTNTTKTQLDKGSYYFVIRLDGSTSVTAYLQSITLTLNEIEEPVISADSTKLNVGDAATLSVSQTSSLDGKKTLTDATYVSSNPEVIHVTSSEGVATVTAVASGSADVTVSYTDLRGNKCTDVISYTATKAGELTYNFNTLAFKFGVDANDDGYADADYGENHDAIEASFGKTNPWYSATDKNFIPAYIEYAASSYYPSNQGYNGYVWGRYNENWRLYHVYQASRFSTVYSNNAPYLTDYAYKNPETTDLWAMVSYSSSIDFYYYSESTQSYMTADYMQFKLNGSYADGAFFTSNGDGTYTRNTRQAPYIIMKINVPTAGTYKVNLAANSSSVTSANYKIYICSADVAIGTNDVSMITDANYIGNMDATVSKSGDLQRTFTAPQAGDYYVTFLMDMDGENYSCASVMNTNLKSLKLTPVPADLDGYTVQQEAVLSDDIRMEFHVTPTGSLIDSYDVYVEDQKIGNVPVETGVKKTIAVSLCASQMSKIITLQPVDGNGDNVGTARTYSLRTYLLDVINETHGDYSDEMVTLAKYTYNYGAKAQINANRDTDRLVDNITVKDKLPGTYEGNALTGSTEGIAAKTATLVLENNIRVRVYFELAAGYDIANFTFTKSETALTPVASGNRYYVEVDNINPQMYKDDVVISVKNAGAGDLTVTYSPMDYIQRAYANANAKAELKDLVVALNGYHEAAVAYRIAYPTDPVA